MAKYLGAALRRWFGPEVGRLVNELKKLRPRLLARAHGGTAGGVGRVGQRPLGVAI
ncbi:MAG: hypothetical protein IPH91_10805 [Elusimicrobia bacterium]|nr:hypothetical protein [Elusimicrobiota bacterium]